MQMDWFMGDWLIKKSVSHKVPENIVILDIDDNSLQSIGPWPWSRQTLAIILKRLFEEHSPNALGLDLILPEPRTEEGDRLLARQIESRPVCLAVAFDLNPVNHSRTIGHLTGGSAREALAVEATGFIASHKRLSDAARCVGHITPTVDADGVIRTLPKRIAWQTQTWTPLPEALLNMADEQTAVKQGGAPLHYRIPYKIRPHNWKTVSVHDLLIGSVPEGFFNGSYVLLGSSALGLSDRITTPLDPWLPGVLVHAEMLNYFLNGDVAPVQQAQWIALFYALMSVLILSLGYKYLQPGWILGLAFSLMAVWLIIANYLASHHSDFSPSLPLVSVLLVILIQMPYEWFAVHKQNRRIARLFRGYLSRHVANQILDSDQDFLKPRLKTITVLFADIEGFTKIAKKMETSRLAQLTTDVLTIMTNEIHAYDGTLDKYIGDAVMAFWNAPIEQPDHADLAVKSARSMLEKLKQFNADFPELPPITIRIGIHTGQAMVGDLGTVKRHTYTAIGDTVNRAHRLHEQSKEYNTCLLISETTSSQLKEAQVGEVGRVAEG